MDHPPLWGLLAAAHPSLLAFTNGERILATVLAMFVMLWFPSMVRCLRGCDLPDDAHRAGLVPIAVAVLIFQCRWFFTFLSDLERGQLAAVANGAMAFALMFGIYVHGKRQGALRLPRAMAVYAGMLTLCVGASVFLR